MVRAYHDATKHHFQRFAAGPHELDWATQPDPFRRYAGAPLLPLERVGPTDEPRYEPAFVAGEVAPRPLDARAVGQLLFDSLALSAWKQLGSARWALRVNPSSGNLHPTEAYLLCGGIDGLHPRPFVAHYAPREHALELRAELPEELWRALAAPLPPGGLWIGLASIPWREAWKYGERAWRYCQHDAGHAIGALGVAALALGWRALLVDDLGADELALLLGLAGSHGVEAEHPDCLLAVVPADAPRPAAPRVDAEAWARVAWRGAPNALSTGHVEWGAIEAVAEAARKPRTEGAWDAEPPQPSGPAPEPDREPIALRRIVRQRRSAVAFDGRTGLARDGFLQALARTLPGPGRLALHPLPWSPRVDLALFVHRVEGLAPGLYLLLRDRGREPLLRAGFRGDFAWRAPAGCPADLPLALLHEGDLRAVSRSVSCHQEIASDGCFSLGMLASFDGELARGAWMYPRLFWECGLVGQLLYLEAEALGLRATGIGCFFDDPVHAVLGLRDERVQSLYHFTVGGPVEDPRLTSLPAYGVSRSGAPG